jgi:hypothetical protein
MKKINLSIMWRKITRGPAPHPFRQLKRGALCTALALSFLLAPQAPAQDFKVPPSVEKLSAKAKETVEVTMDGPMLRWAGKFLNSGDPDEARAAKLVSNLKSIYVRSYEFDHEGGYSHADVDALRSQMSRPEWSKIVGVRSETDGENVDVFFKLEGDKMAGIVVIAAEPRELTFVSIDGPIEIDQLADLSGEFGVPRMHLKGLNKDNLAKTQRDAHKNSPQKDDAKKEDDQKKEGQQ